MAMKRKRSAVYGARKRSRGVRRKVRAMRMSRSMRSKRRYSGKAPIVTVKRTRYSQNWVPATTTTSDFLKQFNVNSGALPDFTSYAATFEEYRVLRVTAKFVPRYTSFDGANTTDTTLPGVTNQAQTHCTILFDLYGDYTPTGTYGSTSYNAMCDSGKVYSKNCNRPFYITWKPTVASGSVTGATNRYVRAKWIKTTDTALAHIGPCVYMHDVNFTGVFGQAFDIFYTTTVQYRGIK